MKKHGRAISRVIWSSISRNVSNLAIISSLISLWHGAKRRKKISPAFFNSVISMENECEKCLRSSGEKLSGKAINLSSHSGGFSWWDFEECYEGISLNTRFELTWFPWTIQRIFHSHVDGDIELWKTATSCFAVELMTVKVVYEFFTQTFMIEAGNGSCCLFLVHFTSHL